MESEGRFLGCLFRKCGALPLLSALSLLSALQLWPIWPSEPNPEVDVPTWWPRGGSPSSRRVCPPWRRRAARTSPGGRSRWSETCPAPGWRCPVWWARGGRALQACPAAKTARARERERERKRNGREMNPGKGRRKGGARESKKWARPCHFTVTLRGFCWRFYPKRLTTIHSHNGLSQSRRATASSSGAGRVRRLAQGHCDTQGIKLATFWLTVNPSPLPPQLLSPQILQLSLIWDSLIRDGWIRGTTSLLGISGSFLVLILFKGCKDQDVISYHTWEDVPLVFLLQENQDICH